MTIQAVYLILHHIPLFLRNMRDLLIIRHIFALFGIRLKKHRRENGKSRASKILLIFIFAFIVTYLIDLIYLYFEFNVKPLWK